MGRRNAETARASEARKRHWSLLRQGASFLRQACEHPDQRTAASASNPIIQRAMFEPERVPVSPFFRRRFPHLVV